MFSQLIKEYTRGRRVEMAILAEMKFKTETKYVHNGAGILRSRGLDGEPENIQWMGLQGLASVSGLGASKIGASRAVTCTLNVSDLKLRQWFFESEQRQIKGQKFVFWGQFYINAQPVDARFHIYTGIGDKLRMTKSGPSQRKLILMLEDRLTRRRRSAHSMVTNSDQQRRDPGSTGFIYVPKMTDQSLNLFDARD